METLRFRSTIFFRSQLAAPWGFSLEREPAPRFHISIDGRFFGGGEENPAPVEVEEMEIVILPPLFQTGSATNLVMCGITRFDTDLSHPLLEALPSLIHLPKFDGQSQIWRLVELIDAEAERGLNRRAPILDRLTEALFLQLLQEFVDHGEGTIGFVAALRDRALRRALELLHREPATPWTIDALATQAALSRATLIRRFRESVGVAPIEYLTRWRLLKAHQLARFSADSIDQIASRVGFSSAQTLTRAFKRFFGVTPSSLRR